MFLLLRNAKTHWRFLSSVTSVVGATHSLSSHEETPHSFITHSLQVLQIESSYDKTKGDIRIRR